MRILKFDAAADPRAEENYKWLLVGFNTADTGRQTAEQTLRNIAVMEKLLAVADEDEAAEAWPFMETALVLKDGPQQVALTESELKWLEGQWRAGFSGYRPMLLAAHYNRIAALLQDAERVGADEAEQRGAKGVRGPRRR